MALTDDSCNSAWLNLNRYDDTRQRPSPHDQQILSELDFLLLEELRELAPDLVIFFKAITMTRGLQPPLQAQASRSARYRSAGSASSIHLF